MDGWIEMNNDDSPQFFTLSLRCLLAPIYCQYWLQFQEFVRGYCFKPGFFFPPLPSADLRNTLQTMMQLFRSKLLPVTQCVSFSKGTTSKEFALESEVVFSSAHAVAS